MGLDGVELVIEIEAAFQIRITDNEAQSARTMGDLFAIILAKSPDSKADSEVLFQSALSSVRASLAECLGVVEANLAPQTRLAEVIPPAQLATVWHRLEVSLGHGLPPIRKDPGFDRWARRAAWWLVGSVVGAIMLAAFNTTFAGIVAISAAYALVLMIGCMAAETWEVPEFYPEEMATLGDLAKAVSWHYIAGLDGSKPPSGDYRNSQVWARLVAIVCKELGADPERVDWHTDLARDLGLG